MRVPNWNDLLPSHSAIQGMTQEQLKAAGQATESYGMTIGFGIAAIGSMLAGYATNEDHGRITSYNVCYTKLLRGRPRRA